LEIYIFHSFHINIPFRTRERERERKVLGSLRVKERQRAKMLSLEDFEKEKVRGEGKR